MEDILFEPHHLIGSLKEEKKKLRLAMKNFVDINALVERCCWKASSGEMEGEAFLEECIALREGMDKMKESYMNLISDREHLLMVAEMYHCAFERETQESERLYYQHFCTIVGLPKEPPVDRLVQSLIPVYQLIGLLV